MKRVFTHLAMFILGFIVGAWVYARAIQPSIDDLVYNFNFANGAWQDCARDKGTNQWVKSKPKIKSLTKWDHNLPIGF